MAANTPQATPSGATFTVPSGWSIETGKNLVVLTPQGAVVRQIVTRTENSTIPRRGELSSTHTLNQEPFAGHTVFIFKDGTIK